MASHHWDFPTTLDLPGHVLHDLRYNNQSHAGLRVLPRRWCHKLNRANAVLVRRILSFLFNALKTVLTCKNNSFNLQKQSKHTIITQGFAILSRRTQCRSQKLAGQDWD
jgi:hypothetical protein